MADIDIRHFTGHRNQIVGHVGVGELAALVVNALLEQCRAEPLHHPPLICSSTSCGLIMVPQSSTTQCLRSLTKPVSVSTSSHEAWTPLVKAKGYSRGT